MLRILFLLLTAVSFVACKTEKMGITSGDSENSYVQALKALDNHRFFIQAEEFSFPGEETSTPIRPSSKSYISMDNKLAVINFASDVYPPNSLGFRGGQTIEDNSAEMKKIKSKKNGDMEYLLNMRGDAMWKDRKVLIVLYGKTNKCFIQITNKRMGDILVNITGKVYPLGKTNL